MDVTDEGGGDSDAIMDGCKYVHISNSQSVESRMSACEREIAHTQCG